MTGAVPNSLIGPRRVIGSSSMLAHARPSTQPGHAFIRPAAMFGVPEPRKPAGAFEHGTAMDGGFWAVMMPYAIRHQVLYTDEGVCDEREKGGTSVQASRQSCWNHINSAQPTNYCNNVCSQQLQFSLTPPLQSTNNDPFCWNH